MARPKEFDQEQARDAAIGVFREHGYEGASAEMLVRAMGVGRQSLYGTFGDKWRLYCASLHRYVAALRSEPRAVDGIRAMIDRVIGDACKACLGVSSICEFGRSRRELVKIHDAAARVIHIATAVRVREAQAAGDVARDLDAEEVAGFIAATFTAIRIAARAGADGEQLQALGRMAMRALR